LRTRLIQSKVSLTKCQLLKTSRILTKVKVLEPETRTPKMANGFQQKEQKSNKLHQRLRVNNGRSTFSICSIKLNYKENRSKKAMTNRQNIDKNVLSRNLKWKLPRESNINKWLLTKTVWLVTLHQKVIDFIKECCLLII